MITTEKKNEAITKFACESPCICFNLRKASRAITQIYDNMFKPIGLRISQVAILNSLRMIGPLTVTQLSEAMATDRTTITRNLKPLKRDGYVKIQSGQDRREREIIITQKGKDTSVKAFQIWEKYNDRLINSVGQRRLEKLCKDLSSTLDEIQKV